jgi:hypothetical protein
MKIAIHNRPGSFSDRCFIIITATIKMSFLLDNFYTH